MATAGVYSSMGVTFVCTLLAFKLMEWYYSPDTARTREQRHMQHLVPVPPPPPPSVAPEVRPRLSRSAIRLTCVYWQGCPGAVPAPRDHTMCPLCRQERVNPAATTSGIVCCYRCLAQHVQRHGMCPVTGVPCRLEHVRKLYEPS